MKKFKPMMCPICDGMYFSELNKDSYEEELEEYLNGEVQCRHCGWIYDLNQFENPDSHEGFNKLSLNEYKKEYEEKIKENPKYDYFEEHKPSLKPHKCPVCGWEETGFENVPDEKPSEYMMSFNEKLTLFKNKRKLNPKYRWDDENN